MARAARGGGTRTRGARAGGTARAGTTAGRTTRTGRRTAARGEETAPARGGRRTTARAGRTTTPQRSGRASERQKRPQTRSRQQDAIAMLKADHATVKDLFKRYQGLSARAKKQKQSIAHRVIKELSIHEVIEEQVLYPTIRDRVPGGGAMADEALKEHRMVADRLTDLDTMDPDDDGFDETMHAIIKDVRAHIKEEEGELFPKLRENIDREGLVKMADLMKMAKKTAPTRPHPHAPATPPGNIIAGMAAGAADRIRDVFRGDEDADEMERERADMRRRR